MIRNLLPIKFIICTNCSLYLRHYSKGLCEKCYRKYHNKKYKRNKFGNYKYRIVIDGYNLIYKPHFKYSHTSGYVLEHRYIYHIYLSVKYNRIVYLPIKKYEIHHINGKRDDNRIKNMILVTKAQHRILEQTIDMSDRFCNLCGSNKTYIRKNGCPSWYYDIKGYLCDICSSIIQYYKKKLGI